MAAILTAILALAQQDQTATRAEKADYLVAVAKCREGEALLESDPRAAVEKFDEVIDNPRVARKIESRLRIEERSGEYTAWYLFLPYQYRGRARLTLARTAPREQAERLLAAAAADFEESVKRGVRSSEAYLKTARAELERLKAAAAAPAEPPKDPEADFRVEWRDLLSRRRYREALERLERAADFLPEARRRAYRAEAEAEGRRHLDDLLHRYAASLAAATPESLARLSAAEMDRLFPLPSPEETAVKLDALAWAAAFRATLEKLRLREEALEDVLRAAAAAGPLEEADGRPWFRGAAELAWRILEPRVRAAAEGARLAPAAERDRLKKEAVALKQRWDALVAAASPALRARLPWVAERARALDEILSRFPIDLEDIEKAAPGLERSFESDRPDAELEKIEKDLRRIHAEHSPRLSLESRRTLLTCLLEAALLRDLLRGASPERIAAREDLRAFGKELRELGGPADAGRFGTKVARLLETLAR
ncbi:MAG TPA: hypothetical protein VNO22_13685 [Planctomycetota bacterium]|nr:hypothetical protein [Planctomycetota bacterium]